MYTTKHLQKLLAWPPHALFPLIPFSTAHRPPPPKAQNPTSWYTQSLLNAEIISTPIPTLTPSGCFPLLPWGYKMWDTIKHYLTPKLTKMGFEEAYFPMLLTEKSINMEKSHMKGLEEEIAWIYINNNTLGLRPTSECIIYPYFSHILKSHRDLPMRITQYANIYRGEPHQLLPLIRSKEFLWQEGHSLEASSTAARSMTQEALNIYIYLYENLLALPVYPGIKSELEKFPGALQTQSVECMVTENGRAIQGATAHYLGTKFSRLFDIQFMTKSMHKKYAFQTSFGISTRSLGSACMVHGDSIGISLPPYLSPIQVLIIPIFHNVSHDIIAKCVELENRGSVVGFRVKSDLENSNSPGWKFNYWERKGVPIRIEVGKKEINSQILTISIRDKSLNMGKYTIQDVDFESEMTRLVKFIHKHMFLRAKESMDNNIVQCENWNEFIMAIKEKKWVIAPW